MESRIDRERYLQERHELARYHRRPTLDEGSDREGEKRLPVKRTIQSEAPKFGKLVWQQLHGIASEFFAELLKVVGLL